MADDADEAHVLALARQGDRAAFGTLVRRYQRRVYAAALHILGNHRDADDVVQETFVRAYRALGTFDGRSALFSWLYRIAVNTALNHRRVDRRSDALAEAGSAEVDHAGGRPETIGVVERTPEEWATLGEELRRVVEAVSGLSPTLRVTLMMAAVEQLPYRQIAEILDIPEGTVAWRVNEARRLLRERLGDAEAPAPARSGEGRRR